METGSTPQMSAKPQSKYSVLKRWGPLFVLAGLVALAFANGWHEQLTLSNLIKNRAAMNAYVVDNYWLSALVYTGIYFVATALLFPAASLITIAGGLVFSSVFATIYTVIGATLGATVLFIVVRTSFGSFLNERAGPFLSKLSAGFKENAFSYLLFLRLVPAFPFWLVNVAPAFFKMAVPTYVGATAIGILPGTFAYALLGEGLDSLILAQDMANPGCAEAGSCKIDLSAAITPEIIAAIIGLIVVSILPVAIKKWREKRNLK
ncbi:MAG: TVP38/TMEM64 family protein [Rhizobiaceae bacterium]|nr:TVP38/TMEM64 family protein [Rhizobiaceae bacterium]